MALPIPADVELLNVMMVYRDGTYPTLLSAVLGIFTPANLGETTTAYNLLSYVIATFAEPVDLLCSPLCRLRLLTEGSFVRHSLTHIH